MPNTNPVLSNAASGAPSTKSGGSRSSARLFPGVPISHNLCGREKKEKNEEGVVARREYVSARHVVPPHPRNKKTIHGRNERTNERMNEREREREMWNPRISSPSSSSSGGERLSSHHIRPHPHPPKRLHTHTHLTVPSTLELRKLSFTGLTLMPLIVPVCPPNDLSILLSWMLW